MTKIKHAHSSGKFDGSKDALAKQVKTFTSSDEGWNLLSWTEVKGRADILSAKGWGTYAPQSTDCAFMFRKSVYELVAKSDNQLTSKTFIDGNGNTKKIIAPTIVLNSKDGILWTSVAHLPSSVQEGDHFSTKKTDQDRVACWKSSVSGWKDLRQKQRDKYHQTISLHIADWNVNFRMSTFRKEVDNRIAGDPSNFRGTWTPSNEPKDGTLGSRLIDAGWTNGAFSSTGLLPDDNASDHRPFYEKINWK